MYTIEQLQGLEYLMKRILNSGHSPLHKAPLKLVIENAGKLWYGDFLNVEGRYVQHSSVSDYGFVQTDQYAPTSNRSGIAVLETIWASFRAHAAEDGTLSRQDPFSYIKEPGLFLDTLLKLVDLADWEGVESPFRPHLLNAQSVDGSIQLPFLILEPGPIRLVSLISVETES